jgi:F-type H+-transporting ATPase subunit b
MPQFEIATYPSQIFWLVICFSVLCVVMARYLVPRLRSSFEAREQRLQEDWDQAKTLKGTEESLKQENLACLAEARGKAHFLIHQAIQEIHRRKSGRIAALDEELTIKVKNIREDLEMQTQDILKNMEPIVSQMVKMTSFRMVGQQLAQPDIKEVVQTALKRRKN